MKRRAPGLPAAHCHRKRSNSPKDTLHLHTLHGASVSGTHLHAGVPLQQCTESSHNQAKATTAAAIAAATIGGTQQPLQASLAEPLQGLQVPPLHMAAAAAAAAALASSIGSATVATVGLTARLLLLLDPATRVSKQVSHGRHTQSF